MRKAFAFVVVLCAVLAQVPGASAAYADPLAPASACPNQTALGAPVAVQVNAMT